MSPGRRLAWLVLYGVAMGLLEAIVVVYLRRLFGAHPLGALPGDIVRAEILREACTIVMLSGVAALAARDRLDGFLVFAFLFGVWDLGYYAGLRALLGWPASFATWDVLFLIPVPWVAPVACPVAVSLALVAGLPLVGRLRARGGVLRPTAAEWAVAVAGAVTIVVAFCWNGPSLAAGTPPARFPVVAFVAGLAAGIVPFVRAGLRGRRVVR